MYNLQWRRFTPTGVGTIRFPHRRLCQKSVHPHGRGDNSLCDSTSCATDGSPPRAWGQSRRSHAKCGSRRFTPTGVGTILDYTFTITAVSVHPHGRGDNLVAAAQWVWANGSPPRAWGQLDAGRQQQIIPRFTPTGVGTMLMQQSA